MYSYEANRIVPGSPKSIRSAIDALIGVMPPLRTRIVTDDGMRRTVAIAGDTVTDEADIWLTWELEPHGVDTKVRVVLDETEPGPDPDLEDLLDRMAVQIRPGQP
jgi:hypothetical protein